MGDHGLGAKTATLATSPGSVYLAHRSANFGRKQHRQSSKELEASDFAHGRANSLARPGRASLFARPNTRRSWPSGSDTRSDFRWRGPTVALVRSVDNAPLFAPAMEEGDALIQERKRELARPRTRGERSRSLRETRSYSPGNDGPHRTTATGHQLGIQRASALARRAISTPDSTNKTDRQGRTGRRQRPASQDRQSSKTVEGQRGHNAASSCLRQHRKPGNVTRQEKDLREGAKSFDVQRLVPETGSLHDKEACLTADPHDLTPFPFSESLGKKQMSCREDWTLEEMRAEDPQSWGPPSYSGRPNATARGKVNASEAVRLKNRAKDQNKKCADMAAAGPDGPGGPFRCEEAHCPGNGQFVAWTTWESASHQMAAHMPVEIYCAYPGCQVEVFDRLEKAAGHVSTAHPDQANKWQEHLMCWKANHFPQERSGTPEERVRFWAIKWRGAVEAVAAVSRRNACDPTRAQFLPYSHPAVFLAHQCRIVSAIDLGLDPVVSGWMPQVRMLNLPPEEVPELMAVKQRSDESTVSTDLPVGGGTAAEAATTARGAALTNCVDPKGA